MYNGAYLPVRNLKITKLTMTQRPNAAWPMSHDSWKNHSIKSSLVKK